MARRWRLGAANKMVVGAAGLRVVSILLAVALGVVLARLGGPSVKGGFSTFSAALQVVFLVLNFEIPQQALREAKESGKAAYVLPWMRRVWYCYAVLVLLVGPILTRAFDLDPAFLVGTVIFMVSWQSGFIATATRGPIRYAASLIASQFASAVAVVCLHLLGVLDVETVAYVVVAGLLGSIVVHWFRAPISVFSHVELDLRLRSVVRSGVLWQLIRSMQNLMLKMDILWVAAAIGTGAAGIYSVALSTAMLSNVLPQQVANRLLLDVVNGRPFHLRNDILVALAWGAGSAVCVGVAGWFLIPVAYGVAFSSARAALIPALFGTVFFGGVQVLSNYLRNIGSRGDFLFALLPGFATMVIGLFAFLPRGGVVAASVVFMISMLVSLIAASWVSFRVRRFENSGGSES